MARHAVALVTALALVAGACSSSEPAAFEPSARPVATATPAPAPAPTSTPLPEPTATAAPTPTPAPSEEELAVIAAWERYVVLGAEARSNSPSAGALDYESYMTEGALEGGLRAITEDRDGGRYVLGPVSTTVKDVTFESDTDALIRACIVTEYIAYSLTDGSVLVEEGRIEHSAEGRLTLLNQVWRVAARQSEVSACAP